MEGRVWCPVFVHLYGRDLLRGGGAWGATTNPVEISVWGRSRFCPWGSNLLEPDETRRLYNDGQPWAYALNDSRSAARSNCRWLNRFARAPPSSLGVSSSLGPLCLPAPALPAGVCSIADPRLFAGRVWAFLPPSFASLRRSPDPDGFGTGRFGSLSQHQFAL